MESRRIYESLKEIMQSPAEAEEKVLNKTDFRELGVVYFCRAEEEFELCEFFSESGDGSCSFLQDIDGIRFCKCVMNG